MKNKKYTLFAGPYIVWMTAFIVIPLLFVCYYGFTDGEGKFTFDNVAVITQKEYYGALGLSVLLAVICTLVCLLLAYPLALILRNMKMKKSSFIVFIFILPMWMNFLLRTYAWQAILDINGVLDGIIMVFVPALTTFVISDILGGGKQLLIGNLVENKVKADNLNLGAGLSLILMIFIVLNMLFTAKYDKGQEGGRVL